MFIRQDLKYDLKVLKNIPQYSSFIEGPLKDPILNFSECGYETC